MAAFMAGLDSLPRLSCGPLSLTLMPDLGGSIARFDYIAPGGEKIPVLRGVDAMPERVVDAASFPLVPYVNRVRGGTFTFRGRTVTMSPNLAGDPSPLHGQGWIGPWAVDNFCETDLEMVFRHDPGEWPWAYESRQRFEVDETGLTAVIDCVNASNEPMPCGLGHHPYFPCSPETRLDTSVESVWEIDDKVLPVAKLPAEGRYGLEDRLVCGQRLDHGFGGWRGVARISDPSLPFDIEMRSPEARFFQLYSPSGGGFFVAEPVSHANAALNEPEERWGELGLRILEPGDVMSLAMRIELIPRQ
jgi:aldose 1-epimerase